MTGGLAFRTLHPTHDVIYTDVLPTVTEAFWLFFAKEITRVKQMIRKI